MSYIKIHKGIARGDVILPASKSILHRAYICAALSSGISVIHGENRCDDVALTEKCLSSLGADITHRDGCAVINGGKIAYKTSLFCGQSASTLRFLLPLMLCGKPVTFVCDRSLASRPMGVYERICSDIGADYVNQNNCITVSGRLTHGVYRVSGDVSSQFISGLMLALPLLDGDSRIEFEKKPKSVPYIIMTQQIMALFGVKVDVFGDKIDIFGGQSYVPCEMICEADESCAAYIAAFNTVGGDVRILNRAECSMQGDAVWQNVFYELCKHKADIDISDTPDLAPVIMAVAAAHHGVILRGTDRLRFKESDRINAMSDGLTACSDANVVSHDDTVTVTPYTAMTPMAHLDPHGDHRIAMALSLLCTQGGGIIDDPECVAKSYPQFFGDLSSLGIKTETGGDANE